MAAEKKPRDKNKPTPKAPQKQGFLRWLIGRLILLLVAGVLVIIGYQTVMFNQDHNRWPQTAEDWKAVMTGSQEQATELAEVGLEVGLDEFKKRVDEFDWTETRSTVDDLMAWSKSEPGRTPGTGDATTPSGTSGEGGARPPQVADQEEGPAAEKERAAREHLRIGSEHFNTAVDSEDYEVKRTEFSAAKHEFEAARALLREARELNPERAGEYDRLIGDCTHVIQTITRLKPA